MPIMAIYRSPDVDRETFNRFRVEAPIEPAPNGAIFHQVAFSESGMLAIDIWESEAAMQAFSEERVYPALEKLGIPLEAPELLQIHALWAAPDARRYNVDAPLPKAIPA